MTIRKYKETDKKEWEKLLSASKNPAFVFSRSFIEYHKEKYEDFSLLIFNDNVLIAAIPACKIEKKIVAHPGLPFSDIIMKDRHTWYKINEILDLVVNFLKNHGFSHIILKLMPSIYKNSLSDELLYFFRYRGATLTEQKLTCAIPLHSYESISKNIIHESKYNNVAFDVTYREQDIKSLHELLESTLYNKYNAVPTHSLSEIIEIAEKFPDNIHFASIFSDGKLVGGAILFMYINVVKLQYIFSVQQYAADVLLLSILHKIKDNYAFFDLGTSNSLPKNEINYGNLRFKSKNGGKACVAETYTLDLN